GAQLRRVASVGEGEPPQLGLGRALGHADAELAVCHGDEDVGEEVGHAAADAYLDAHTLLYLGLQTPLLQRVARHGFLPAILHEAGASDVAVRLQDRVAG